jgi:predicted nucleotidyltransferase component of viral defense system
MLNREKHQLIMTKILKDIYSDTEISSLLGFKGGTCAYFFYKLPRFSVDLDFDLQEISEGNKKIVFEKVLNILNKYGKIKDQCIKKYTIFALLSYGDDNHNIKIEINVRNQHKNIYQYYEIKDYLGISMVVAKKDYLFASKLAALTSRNETAMRDVYDIHFFASINWDINSEIIKERTGKSIKENLSDCIVCLEKIKDNQILRGLGELVDGNKEKDWIKKNLKNDSIFMLKNYRSVLK